MPGNGPGECGAEANEGVREDTDPELVCRLREAVETGRELSVDPENYRADGTALTERQVVAPIEGESGKVRAFPGVRTDLSRLSDEDASAHAAGARPVQETDTLSQELQHRMKNHATRGTVVTLDFEAPG